MRKVNFKKSYSKEVFSLNGKKIFFGFLFVISLLLIFSFLLISCENGFCPKKVSELIKLSSTGKVVDSGGTDYNSISELSKLVPGDASIEDSLFGHAMETDGKTLFVSAPYDDEKGENSGAVYIFEKSSSGSWVFHSKLFAPYLASSSLFGSFISLHENKILIRDSYGASLYSRNLNGDWVIKNYFFGRDVFDFNVSQSGISFTTTMDYRYYDSLRRGCDYSQSYLTASSCNYSVFENFMKKTISDIRNTYGLTEVRDEFKYPSIGGVFPVFLSENFLFISGFREDSPDSALGLPFSIRVFEKNSSGFWRISQEIRGITPKSLFFFEDTLFVGVPANYGYSGSVYVFKKNLSGIFQTDQILKSNGNSPVDFFGQFVIASGDSLFIGAPNDNFGVSSQAMEYSDWKRGWLYNPFEALTLAYKYNRPVIYAGDLITCSNSKYYREQVLDTEEFIEYAYRNKIVLLRSIQGISEKYAQSIDFSFIDSSSSPGPSGNAITMVFKVNLYPFSGSKEEYFIVPQTVTAIEKFPPVVIQRFSSSTYNFALFNYLDGYNRGSINGVHVTSRIDPATSHMVHDSANYIKVIESFFPNQFWESISPGKDYGGGSVYVFKKDSSGKWVQKERIAPDDLSKSDSFGESISVDGNFLVVGSSSKPKGTTPNKGSAYVFKKDSNGSWKLLNSLSSSSPSSLFFGKSVLISNNSLLVSSGKNTFMKSGGDVFSFKLFEKYVDKTPPTVEKEFNYSFNINQPISIQLNAQDESGISSWRIASSPYFSITSAGLIKNKSFTPGVNYSLIFFVNDSFNNVANGKVNVEVVPGPYCGDLVCNKETNENCSNCVGDCGSCPINPVYSPSTDLKNASVSRFELFESGYHTTIPVGNSILFPFEEDNYEMVLDKLFNDSLNVSIYKNNNKIHSGFLNWEFSKDYDIDLNGDGEYDLTFSPLEQLFGEASFEIIFYTDSSLEENSPLVNENVDATNVVVESFVNSFDQVVMEDFTDDSSTEDSSSTDSSNINSDQDEEENIPRNSGASFSDSSEDEDSFPLDIVLFVIVLLVFISLVFYLFLKGKTPNEKANSNFGVNNNFSNPPSRGMPVFKRNQIQNRNPLPRRPASSNQNVIRDLKK